MRCGNHRINMAESCNDCLKEATSSLVVNNYLVHVCDECERHHQLQPIKPTSPSLGTEGVKVDRRQPWETKIRPLYTEEQRLAYIHEKYVTDSFKTRCLEEESSLDEVVSEVDRVPIVYAWPVKEAASFRTGANLSIALDMVRGYGIIEQNGQETMFFKRSNIRYASLLPVACGRLTASSCDCHVVVMLCILADEDQHATCLFLELRTYRDAFALLNMIRACIFKEQGKSVTSLNHIDAEMFCVVSAREFGRFYGGSESPVCVVDPECLMLVYSASRATPLARTAFYEQQKQSRDVIDQIELSEDRNELRIEIKFKEFELSSVDDDPRMIKELYTRLGSYLHGIRAVKAQTASSSPSVFRGNGSVVRAVVSAMRSPALSAEGTSPSLLRDCLQRAYGSSFLHSGAPIATSGSLGATAFPETGTKSRSTWDAILSDMERELAEEADDAPETLGVLWAVAEDEIQRLEQTGLIPGSPISSGGLDPDSRQHFGTCLEEIREAIFDQRYDVAASHARGLQQVFRSSNEAALAWFVSDHDLITMTRFIFLTAVINILGGHIGPPPTRRAPPPPPPPPKC